MSRIQLLLDNTDTRSTLHGWLSAWHDVTAPDVTSQVPETEHCDLLVVDHAALTRYGNWIYDLKKAERPVVLPVLFVSPRGAFDSVDPVLWHCVDDVLSLPLERTEVHLRVSAMLRIRTQSLQLKAHRDGLLRASKVIPTPLHVDSIDDDHGIGLISVYTDISKRKRAESLMRSQRVWTEALRDTKMTLASTLDLDEVLKRILINIRRVVPHEFACVMLTDDNGEEACIVRSLGFERLNATNWLHSQRYVIEDEPVLQQMVMTGEPVLISLILEDWYAPRPLSMRQIKSYISAPIRLKGAVIGFLYLFSTEVNFFSMTHAERLAAFAKQTTIAIQNARLYEKAQALAMLEERHRLARDLHDAVSQTLFSASVIAESLPRLWKSHPQKVGPRLNQLRRLTRGAMAEMRTLLLELRPSALTEARLDELLRHLTDALQGRTTIDVTLTVRGRRKVPADVQTAFYYIAQEALNNIVKRADASRVDVWLESNRDHVELVIGDDGKGFEGDMIPPASMGLDIMRERAESVGAALSITSQPGQGTQITVVFTDTEQEETDERITSYSDSDR